MAKHTSISLGTHFETFIAGQLRTGRYGNASEIIRAGLRLLEEREHQLVTLRRELLAGSQSGDAGALDFEEIKKKARQRTSRKRAHG